MKFHDPNRPCLGNGHPTFLWGQGMQEPSLRSCEGGGWEISLMLGSGGSHWHWYTVANDEALLDWLRLWREDPEGLIHRCWPDFAPQRLRAAPSTPAAKKTFSLEDII